MKKRLFCIVLPLILYCLLPLRASAQNATIAIKQQFYKAKVLSIVEEGKTTVGTTENIFQKARIRILEGSDNGKEMILENGGTFTITEAQKVAPGETVIVSKTITKNTTRYAITDKYRLQTMLWIIGGFFILVLVITGRKGLGAILGMLISIIIILAFIVPQILSGANPLLISVIGSLFIMVTTIYLAHGFSQQTHIAIAATFLSLIITALSAIIFVKIANLSGLGSEDIYTLVQGFQGRIQFQGLLLGSIIIGSLGVLDDITTTQAATIFTLEEADPTLSAKQLFSKGMAIGREHIASLVNTLVLAYAGAAIGVFIYFSLGQQYHTQPLWVMLNSELIGEEIIRTLAGSIGLILAVPITTILAAFFAKHELKLS